ncbi:MAG: OB-fold domain-containing protein [Pseudonocardia sp.]|nr:OB-fold domain-containing protein [Pseudonocardia sp.]
MPVGPIHRDLPSTAFFDGTARGELLLRRCTACGHLCEPSTMTCPSCTGRTFDATPAAGGGRVVSWTVVHTRNGAGTVRTPVALVELDEGPWLEGQLVDVEPDRISTAMGVRVDFERAEGGEAIPVFRIV